ncbi:helix-turn-helix transcriptional regulator [Streptomyces sp. NPDC059224]|uniref:helix-turn-helix transcriptional regulator n=1 Tax=Streptomyces sp. NPDC059224 TaxID=3346775 RepID=UPI0036A848A6
MPLDPPPDWLLPRRREIGNRIRAAREERGLSQNQLADLIGREYRTILRWEYAQRIPNLEDLLLIADVLGVPVSDLVR